ADKRRSEYYNYYSYKTWGAAATYHLCVDSSSLGIEETVRFVEEFVAKKLQIGM
ncbi:cytidylate kinase-like family protein, partial [Bacteroides thetaiotaomicron]